MSENGGKKNPWAMVGIGCGIAVVIGLVVLMLLVGWCKKKVDDVKRDFEGNPAKFTAEMVVKANPDLELVRTDDAAGTMTVLDKKTGKETTLNFEDAAEGRFTVETDGTTATIDGKSGQMTSEGPDGSSTFNVGGLEKMPKWFEVPEGLTGWKSVMHQEQGAKVSGMVHGKTTHEAEDVYAAFEANLKTAGFERTSKTETKEVIMASFQNAAKTRNVSLTINRVQAERVVSITYSGK